MKATRHPTLRLRISAVTLSALLFGLLYATAGGTALVRQLAPELLVARGDIADGIRHPGGDAEDLDRHFDELGYDLDQVGRGDALVPRLYLARVPNGLDETNDLELKKGVFFRSVLPLVLRVNEAILADRQRLLALIKRGSRPTGEEAAWLASLEERYGVENDLAELVRRVDMVPPSLALAQAAEESGWGTSRFAKIGNSLFGQWTTDPAKAMRPKGRAFDNEEAAGIRTFPSLTATVRSYIHNLNTHKAYRAFRTERAAMRRSGQELDGHALAGSLTGYSERGEDYVGTIRGLIRGNGLFRLDHAKLTPLKAVERDRGL